MHKYDEVLPSFIADDLTGFFSLSVVQESMHLLIKSQISLSFYKEVENRYVIIAGIINDNYPHQSRMTYRFPIGEKPTVKSSCDCGSWKEESHCSHAAALLLKYLLQKHQEKHHEEKGTQSGYHLNFKKMF